MNIKSETKNKLLKRDEIVFVLQSDANPGYEGAKKALLENKKASEDTIAIKSVKNNYGTNEFVIEAFIYNSKEDKERIEPKQKEKKGATA